MRKILAIVVGLYLAGGVVFGLATDPENHMCTATPNDEGTVYYGAINDIPQIPWYCGPTIGPVDRLRWVAVSTPAWLPLVIRNVVQEHRRAEPASHGDVDPPIAKTPRQALAYYLNAVQHRDCGVAEFYTTVAFHHNGDLCHGPRPGGLAFDDWHIDPKFRSEAFQPEPGVHIYAVELHITKHGCAGSICSNGWHVLFFHVSEMPRSGYLLISSGTGP